MHGEKEKIAGHVTGQTFSFKESTSVFVTSVNPCLVQDHHESGQAHDSCVK